MVRRNLQLSVRGMPRDAPFPIKSFMSNAPLVSSFPHVRQGVSLHNHNVPSVNLEKSLLLISSLQYSEMLFLIGARLAISAQYFGTLWHSTLATEPAAYALLVSYVEMCQDCNPFYALL